MALNEYRWKDILIGKSEKFQVTITQEMLENFKKLSGDINPLHTDKEYAISKGFDNIVVYGLLTSAFYSTLGGVYLPGKYCLFQECNIGFNAPVYIGDTLTIEGKVLDKNEAFKRITIKATIRNQAGKRVSSAKMVVGCMED